MNNRLNALGLGTLVLGALIALGNFGYTMVATNPANAAPVASGASAIVENAVTAPESTNPSDAVDFWFDTKHTHSQSNQPSDRHGRHTGGDSRRIY